MTRLQVIARVEWFVADRWPMRASTMAAAAMHAANGGSLFAAILFVLSSMDVDDLTPERLDEVCTSVINDFEARHPPAAWWG